MTTLRFEYPGTPALELDLSSLELDRHLTNAMGRALTVIAGKYTRESMKQAWLALKLFARYLCSSDQRTRLRAEALSEYREWLCETTYKNSTRQTVLNLAARFVSFVASNQPDLVLGSPALRVAPFAKQRVVHRAGLPEEDLKKILAACYEEIDAVWQDFQTGTRLLRGDIGKGEDELAMLLRAGIEEGRLGVGIGWARANGLYRRVVRYGGCPRLNRYLFLTNESVLPFYIALCAQLAGNPMAVLDMRRNCLFPHEVYEHRRWVVWAKPRAGREQRRDFDYRRPYSAPKLIEMLLEMSSRILPHLDEHDRSYLFVHKFGQASRCKSSNLALLRMKFIARHHLPEFDFASLRPTSAALHRKETRDIKVVQRLLNHKDATVTTSYLDARAEWEAASKLVHHFQGRLIHGLGLSTALDPLAVQIAKPAETLFGFLCRNPFDGVAPRSRKGERCERFDHCVRCPGSIVPVDDPQVVAVILQAHQHLLKWRLDATNNGWSDRFHALYEPTLLIVEKDILPVVPAETLSAAREMVATLPPLPDLE